MKKILYCLLLLTITPSLWGKEKSTSELEFAKRINYHIDSFLKKKRLGKTKPISDAQFLRKVYLDIIGRIPTLDEIKSYLESNDKDKKSELIDKLQSSNGYVSHNYNYWGDALRLKWSNNFPTSYFSFVKQSLKENKPYDQFVNELLKAEGHLEDYKTGAIGYYMRDKNMPLDNLANTLTLFLGTDMVCAQCHDHPFDRWSQLDFYRLAAFSNGLTYGQVPKSFKNKVNQFEKDQKNNKTKAILARKMSEWAYKSVQGMGTGLIRLPSDYSYNDHKPHDYVEAGVPFGPTVKLETKPKKPKNKIRITRKGIIIPDHIADIGSRKVFADWVTSPENPMFTKTIVNRLWDKAMGAPLIGDSLLSIDLKSEGLNKPLVTELIKIMQTVDFDLKKFEKILYLSYIYQSRSLPVDINYAKKQKNYFQGPLVRRLSAEQVWDSMETLKSGSIDSKLSYNTKLTPKQYFHEINKDKSPEELFENVPDGMNFMSFQKSIKQAADQHSQKLYPQPDSGPTVNTNKRKRRVAHYTGRASEMNQPASNGSPLRELGQSSRTLIDAKSLEPSAPQALLMMNKLASEITQKPSHQLMQDIASGKSKVAKVTNAFLAILTRKPTAGERVHFQKLLSDKQNGMKNLAWVLINTNEFKFKH
ncbi:MAG: DUF1549 and DUF1553 domain-containing protein [Lentisphaeraceae bacterium]|nr:DUF1549 and DUF1553 domain-containing protein [Lentisphaeraceae bacterium]